ncbi:hypothetical protein MTO96_015418 [Rhipicephalus appendiculatus]
MPFRFTSEGFPAELQARLCVGRPDYDVEHGRTREFPGYVLGLRLKVIKVPKSWRSVPEGGPGTFRAGTLPVCPSAHVPRYTQVQARSQWVGKGGP